MLRVEGTEHGDGQWGQITWDEAFKLIADKWKGYQVEFGTNSVTYWQGSGNHYTNGGYSLFDITPIGALTGSSGIPGGSCSTSEQVMGYFTNVRGKYGSMSETPIGIPYHIPGPYMSTVMEKQEF